MVEIRTAIPDRIDRYLESLVRTGPFTSKAELVRAALLSYAGIVGPMAKDFDKENMISPDGRIYQLEYARESSMRGGPGVGVVYEGGVLLAGEAYTAGPLMKPAPRVRHISKDVALLASGIASDAYILRRRLERAPPTSTEELVDELVQAYWEHTVDRQKRPLAAALLVASKLEAESRLFYFDPSGACQEYEAAAIGLEADRRTEILAKEYRRGTKEEAEKLALKALGHPDRFDLIYLET